MAHISSIGAAMFSDLSIATPAIELSPVAIAQLDAASEFQALFATEIPSIGGVRAAGAFVRVGDVREFPAMGTPPNVVNVPVFGKKTSSQIQGQSDAPSMEITVNFIASNWAKEAGNILGTMVGDSIQRVFRFTLLNTEPTQTGGTKWASTVSGIGSVQNSQYYWIGKLEAQQITPGLTDATTAVVTITMQSEFFGAFTV